MVWGQLSRNFEDKLAASIHSTQKFRGFLHPLQWQKPVLQEHLPQWILPKGQEWLPPIGKHVQPIGMGVDPKKVMAELYGKVPYFPRDAVGYAYFFQKTPFFMVAHGNRRVVKFLWAGWAFAIKYFKKRMRNLSYMVMGAFRHRFHFTKVLTWQSPLAITRVFGLWRTRHRHHGNISQELQHSTNIWNKVWDIETPLWTCKTEVRYWPRKWSKDIDRARSGGVHFLENVKPIDIEVIPMSDAHIIEQRIGRYKKIDRNIPILTV